MNRSFLVVGLFCLLGICALPAEALSQIYRDQSAAILLAATDTDRVQVEGQLSNVERLLNTSSGARRVIGSDNSLAKKIREDGLHRHELARKAYDKGDYETARTLLGEASKSMFQAIRILGTPAELTEKKITDFEARASSVSVLIQALERISSDEGQNGKVKGTIEGINATLTRARKLMEAKEYDDARRLLDGGYEVAKQAVDHLRDGKTLVRTLNFASPEEEYRYELDRNDTHQMLVKVLLEEKQPTEQTLTMVNKLVGRAAEYRSAAEAQANKGQFEEAIKTMEQATKELVRAIRSAGVYIPG